MGRPLGQQPHTLAQFARRAGISEGRARALYNQRPSPLPRPDGADADGKPLWWGSTIDAWCSRTGREVPEDSLWIFRAPPAKTPPVELTRGVVELGRNAGTGRSHPMYAIVWDTEHGHVIYLQPLDDTGDHRDWLAVHAAELIEPRWWSSAVVVMPISESFSAHKATPAGEIDQPIAYIYQLATDSPDGSGDAGTPSETLPGLGAGLLGDRIRRFLGRIGTSTLQGTPGTASADAARPRARWVTHLECEDIAAKLGAPIPVWIDGTENPENAGRTLAYDRTFTVPDTTTEWPATQNRLAAAVKVGMPAEFPAAFAALAFDAAGVLDEVRKAHTLQPDKGPGWYLACRPAPPAPPVDIERYLLGVNLVADTNLVTAELTELRAVEAELDIDDDRGEPYAEAATLLYWQLRRAAVEAGALTDLSHGYMPVVDDDHVHYTAPWKGPVVQAWADTLTELTGPDRTTALRKRRVQRLLARYHLDAPNADSPQDVEDAVEHVYRDDLGRYVLVVKLSSETRSVAEWPKSLAVVDAWNDKTVLAADNSGGAVTLLALTPTDDGRMRTDPVPMPPRSHRNAFGYGYSGGTPGTTYGAVLRCALGDTPAAASLAATVPATRDNSSQLWEAISTTQGPLRLYWPQVQLWARADRRRVDG
jgi:hypothetical protein